MITGVLVSKLGVAVCGGLGVGAMLGVLGAAVLGDARRGEEVINPDTVGELTRVALGLEGVTIAGSDGVLLGTTV